MPLTVYGEPLWASDGRLGACYSQRGQLTGTLGVPGEKVTSRKPPGLLAGVLSRPHTWASVILMPWEICLQLLQMFLNTDRWVNARSFYSSAVMGDATILDRLSRNIYICFRGVH